MKILSIFTKEKEAKKRLGTLGDYLDDLALQEMIKDDIVDLSRQISHMIAMADKMDSKLQKFESSLEAVYEKSEDFRALLKEDNDLATIKEAWTKYNNAMRTAQKDYKTVCDNQKSINHKQALYEKTKYSFMLEYNDDIKENQELTIMLETKVIPFEVGLANKSRETNMKFDEGIKLYYILKKVYNKDEQEYTRVCESLSDSQSVSVQSKAE